jgi:hypothetical protein
MAQQLQLTIQHNIEELCLPHEYIGIEVYTRSDKTVPPFNLTRCIENDMGLNCPGRMCAPRTELSADSPAAADGWR